jgi:hypothetical protein
MVRLHLIGVVVGARLAKLFEILCCRYFYIWMLVYFYLYSKNGAGCSIKKGQVIKNNKFQNSDTFIPLRANYLFYLFQQVLA